MRQPKCARCRNHGKIYLLKGHKRFCPWKLCRCARCVLVEQRQLVSRQQIKLRREQQLEEQGMPGTCTPVESSLSGHSGENSISTSRDNIPPQNVVCLTNELRNNMSLRSLALCFPNHDLTFLRCLLLMCNNNISTAVQKLQETHLQPTSQPHYDCNVIPNMPMTTSAQYQMAPYHLQNTGNFVRQQIPVVPSCTQHPITQPRCNFTPAQNMWTNQPMLNGNYSAETYAAACTSGVGSPAEATLDVDGNSQGDSRSDSSDKPLLMDLKDA